MELILLALVLYLLSSSNNREHNQLANSIGGGILSAIVLVVVGGALLLGFAWYPLVTKIVLAVIGVVLLALMARWIYNRWFSPEARLKAAYQAMHDRWYALSWHVVGLELRRFATADLDRQRQRGEEILNRCRQQHELYKQLPPEGDGNKYRAEFYPTSILDLQQRLHNVSAHVGR